MLKRSKLLISIFMILSAMLMVGDAVADTSVSWISPPDGSSYVAGTAVTLTGQASASGTTGGTGLDLALVIDVSGSMSGSGLTAAKNAAIALINSLPNNTTQVAIIAFNSAANTVQQLTDLTANKTSLINAVNSLSAGGGTTIGNGITAATAELTSIRAIAGHAKMQVVLSDGYSSGNPSTAAAAAYAAGITVHSVGVPGHDSSQMQAIATAGHGVYTNVTSLDNLTALFSGTGGNLVGLDHVEITLADGTFIGNYAIDGLGNFVLPDEIINLGPNTFIATAYDTLGNSATDTITLYGTPNAVPEPGTLALVGMGFVATALFRRRRMKK